MDVFNKKATRDAKNRLRDVIVANGLTYSAGVGLFAMAEGYVQARIARLIAERDEAEARNANR